MTRLSFIVGALLSLCGCASFVADEIVGVPTDPVPIVEVPRNDENQTPMDLLTASTGIVTAKDGAKLHFSIIDPADRGFRSAWFPASEATEEWNEANVVRLIAKAVDDESELIGTVITEFLAAPADPKIAPIGTVILLHGFGMDRWQMMTWAVELAEHGWRAVLVDLRGHGQSGGRYRTWGPQDGEDLQAVADALTRDGLRVGPMVAVGTSYGGVAALHWAARDERIGAVVTLGAFADAGETIREGARVLSRVGRMAPRALVERGIARASDRVGHDLSDDDALLRAGAAISAPVLLVHGVDDRLVPATHGERLHAAIPKSSLWKVGEVGHVGVVLRHDLVGPVVRCWLDRATSGNLDDAGHDLDCVPGDANPVAVEGAP